MVTAISGGFACAVFSKTTPPPKVNSSKTTHFEPATSPAKPQEWEKWRYGMFISFGMSTFSGVEMDKGQSPSTLYNPTNLDVRQWVKVAKEAGMTYAVLTTKHVAGHCLWDSKYTDYDVATSANKTDVVEQFMKACKAEGIRPGLYYCLIDTHHQGGDVLETLTEPADSPRHWSKAPVTDEYFAFAKKQLIELHTRYRGIQEQWIDIPLKVSDAQRQELYDAIKKLSPNCMIIMNQAFSDGTNNAIIRAHWPTDLINGEVTSPPARHQPWRQIEHKQYYLPMEVCDTVGRNWFWQANDAPRPTDELLRIYSQSVGRGTNLLLDVPPDMTGQIPARSVEALMNLKKAIAQLPVSAEVTGEAFAVTGEASTVYQDNINYRAELAFDGDPNTRWGSADGDRTNAWLEINLGRERVFNRVEIDETFPNRIQKFVLEKQQGKGWKVFYEGTLVGKDFRADFAPVKARVVRLRVIEATLGPTINTFALLPAG